MERSWILNKSVYIRWFCIRLGMVLFDIFAVNFAYFIALIIRFYVNFEINEWAVRYIPAFRTFAPWYTAACLVIFGAFKLYNNRWKYAGLNDMNRILLANLATFVVQVAGSVVFVLRMPITYYAIGGVIQLCLIAASRFSYRLFLMERSRVRSLRKGTCIPVMIVGVGETSHLVRRHLERDTENAAHPVCLVDFRGEEFGNMLEGLPVISGVNEIADAIKKYSIECVILADTTMPKDVRTAIRDICTELNVEVQNFAGYFQDARGAVTLRNLMEYTKGEVELVINGKSQQFANGEQAVMSVTGKYVVKSVCAKENRLVVELQKDILVPNDVKEEWVQTYEKQTGEDISFF
ncbi:MAG: hypothetical protein MSS60_06335 [Clostridiales bacterium]|nr:hypothetical protein [Clostridiales bacterium]